MQRVPSLPTENQKWIKKSRPCGGQPAPGVPLAGMLDQLSSSHCEHRPKLGQNYGNRCLRPEVRRPVRTNRDSPHERTDWPEASGADDRSRPSSYQVCDSLYLGIFAGIQEVRTQYG